MCRRFEPCSGSQHSGFVAFEAASPLFLFPDSQPRGFSSAPGPICAGCPGAWGPWRRGASAGALGWGAPGLSRGLAPPRRSAALWAGLIESKPIGDGAGSCARRPKSARGRGVGQTRRASAGAGAKGGKKKLRAARLRPPRVCHAKGRQARVARACGQTDNKKRGRSFGPRFLLLPIAVAMRPDRRSGPKPGAVGRH